MSGILMAASTGARASAPPPLVAGWAWSGNTSINVSGASGNVYDAANFPHNVIGGGPSGGTPPYSGGTSLNYSGFGPGSASLGVSGDGVRQTIFYSGMNLGDNLFVYLSASATDSGSPPQSVSSSNFANVTLHRTS